MIGKDYEKLMKLTYKFEQKELYPSFKIRVYIHGFWSEKKKKQRDRLQPVRGLAWSDNFEKEIIWFFMYLISGIHVPYSHSVRSFFKMFHI